MGTPLASGSDIIIKQKVGSTNTPLYPITKTANVVNTSGDNLDTIIGTLALDSAVVKLTQLGVASVQGGATGVATLDTTGKVPSSQLPSYVDDVIEGYMNGTTFYTTKTAPAQEGDDPTYSGEVTPEAGKIYVDVDTNISYRWGGSVYVAIASSLALGTTSSTAFRGDYGQTAYTHATDSNKIATAETSGLYKFATTAQGHVASVTAVEKADITALGIPEQDTTYSDMVASGTNHAGGLVPDPGATAGTTKYLREDGTWVAPPDTTYSAATQSADGLMSSTDKTKLDNTDSITASTTTPSFTNGLWFEIQE